MKVTHDDDCEHRLGHDCTCGASNHLRDLAAARAEIERLTKERDEAVAAAYEAAAIRSENYACGAPYNQRASINALANSLRGMTPANAQSVFEAYGREKVREGMQRAVDLYPQGIAAILADMEKLK